MVLGVFVSTALLWVMGKSLTDLLKHSFPELATSHVEALIAMAAALVLLLWRVEGGQALGKAGLLRVPGRRCCCWVGVSPWLGASSIAAFPTGWGGNWREYAASTPLPRCC